MMNQRVMLTRTFIPTISSSSIGRALGGLSFAFSATILALLFWPSISLAQSSTEDAPRQTAAALPRPPNTPEFPPQRESDANRHPQSNPVTTSRNASSPASTSEGKQSKRIL